MRQQSVYDEMSEAEAMVASYINYLGFWWNYEQPVYISDDKDRPRIFVPDFYIPEIGIYVEVIGHKHIRDYDRTAMLYRKNNTPIIFVEVNNFNWQNELRYGIVTIHQNRWEKIRRMESDDTM